MLLIADSHIKLYLVPHQDAASCWHTHIKLYRAHHRHAECCWQANIKLYQVHHRHAASCWQSHKVVSSTPPTCWISLTSYHIKLCQLHHWHAPSPTITSSCISRTLLPATWRSGSNNNSGDGHFLQRLMPSLHIFSETCTWHERHNFRLMTCGKHSCL